MAKKVEFWKVSEVKIVTNPNLSTKQIYEMLPNRTIGAIRSFRYTAGVRRISARDAIHTGIMDGLSAAAIAAKYDFDYEYISSLMVKVKKRNDEYE